MNDPQNKARARARELVGNGYIYGAKGQTCTPAFRSGQAKQYPDQIDNILRVGAKWDGKPVWDCAQLTRTVAAAAEVTLVSGATSQWRKTAWARSGTIDTLPREGFAFVYRQSGEVMQHTGVALGNGTCIHARGTAYGVVEQSMDQYAWTHWASPWEGKETEEGGSGEMETLCKATVTAPKGKTVRVREQPGGKVLGTLPVGSVVDVFAESPGWWTIGYQGKRAYMQCGFLARVSDGGLEARVKALEEWRKVLEGAGG